MLLNGKNVITTNSITEEEVKKLKHSIKLIEIIADLSKLTKVTVNDLKNLNTFMQNHCKPTHYGFQIRKS